MIVVEDIINGDSGVCVEVMIVEVMIVVLIMILW